MCRCAASWGDVRCYRDLGPDWHARRTNRDKKIRTHIQGLKALGVTVAITDDEHAA